MCWLGFFWFFVLFFVVFFFLSPLAVHSVQSFVPCFFLHRCHDFISLDDMEMDSVSLSCARLVLCLKTQQSIMCQQEEGRDSTLFTQVYPQNYSNGLSLELLNSQSLILTALWQADNFINYNKLC